MTEEQEKEQEVRTSHPMTRKEAKLFLRSKGFVGFEIVEFLRKTRTQPDGTIKEISPLIDHIDLLYVANWIEERGRAFNSAKAAGIRGRAYYSMILDELYHDMEYITVEGKPDFWAYFRSERDKAIDGGDYIPPVRKPRGQPLTMEKIKKEGAKLTEKRELAKYTRTRSPAPEIGEVFFNEQTGKFELRLFKEEQQKEEQQ